MEILLAAQAGFCFGVKRAIKMTYDTARENDGEVGTIGPLIHNPQVVARLEEMGVHPVEGVKEFQGETLIIRSHGVPPSVYEEAEGAGVRLVDATCPFVKNAQDYASLLRKEGYRVVIVGDRNHPEVQGIMAYAGERASVTVDAEDLRGLGKVRRIGVIAQTTIPLERFQRVVGRCLEIAGEVKVFNTICDATRVRQEEAQSIARKVDLMLVVGGRNSGNTTRLAELCRETGTRTLHLETVKEVDPAWLAGVEKVGITAGASTPEWIIREVVDKLHDLSDGEGQIKD
ncbi:MAG: 4-hydroxy-3-methylbut-2-enyl diphosphate reductase [Deltaproteobacteria bacterium]|nr:4-hydroxy-3-methylbut-2-enyl diphosphate reductase [Deltaproteobacteria bacterium]